MNIGNIYINSLLSVTAYANNLRPGDAGSILVGKLTDSTSGVADITLAQAQYIADNFRVVEQQENTDSGFSATLFERIDSSNNGTGEYYFAIRGSENTLTDWLGANLDNGFNAISRNQTVDMLNFYLKLITPANDQVAQYQFSTITSATPPNVPYIDLGPVSEFDPEAPQENIYQILEVVSSVNGLGAIKADDTLTVTGHSLGGHLASEFSLLFPGIVTDTVTFNSPGFVGFGDNKVNDFNQLLSATLPQISSTILYSPQSLDWVTDITSPTDVVSHLGDHLGTNSHEAFIESTSYQTLPQPIVAWILDNIDTVRENHSIDRLSDTLAVINFMYTLDNGPIKGVGDKRNSFSSAS